MANVNYLNGISNESLAVLQYFGAEAPLKLNTYACLTECQELEWFVA
ncbi:hypothetical protein [Synechococcus sp. EJ6-Ellesmere]|nr:hypothetical protein [Synechococcus sp. EJ6-Ellesmere]MCP9826460.1 hypothetical protein [Synechococcus sp. EJ6-Ellesmere]